jgi:serpin B
MYYLLIALIALAPQALALGKRPENTAPVRAQEQSETALHLPGAVNQLGFDLLSELTKKSPGENVFISPYSIHSALCMAFSGARGGTATAMAAAMHVSKWTPPLLMSDCSELRQGLASADSLVRFDIANSLWSRQGLPLRADFRSGVEKHFGGRAQELDFGSPQALGAINGWVKEKTNGKIDKILERIPPDAALYLINAIYFKGKWKVQFDKTLTSDQDFLLPGGQPQTMPFMRQDGEYQYLRGKDFQAARLPYGTGRFAMYLFLPDRSDGLGEFLKKVNAENWGSWLSGFAKAKGHVELPRFKADYFRDLVPSLDKLGMGPAFGQAADFSGMAPAGLSIDEVLHKTVVEVNEEGTEAAAVTSIGVKFTSVRPEPEPFRLVVDHPFLMAIVDGGTGSILFIGAIYGPR